MHFIRPIWSYSIQIRSSAKSYHSKTIHAFWVRLLTTSTLLYIKDVNQSKNLKIPSLKFITGKLYTNFHSKLYINTNLQINHLSPKTIPDIPLQD